MLGYSHLSLQTRAAPVCRRGRHGLAAICATKVVTDKAKVFHSFRHTVKDALRRGGADHEMREALIGHAQASTVSWRYGAKEMLSKFGRCRICRTPSTLSRP